MSGTKFTFTPEPYERVRNLKDLFVSFDERFDMDLYRFRVKETLKETARSVWKPYCTAISVILYRISLFILNLTCCYRILYSF
jgi:hypothetical protein